MSSASLYLLNIRIVFLMKFRKKIMKLLVKMLTILGYRSILIVWQRLMLGLEMVCLGRFKFPGILMILGSVGRKLRSLLRVMFRNLDRIGGDRFGLLKSQRSPRKRTPRQCHVIS